MLFLHFGLILSWRSNSITISKSSNGFLANDVLFTLRQLGYLGNKAVTASRSGHVGIWPPVGSSVPTFSPVPPQICILPPLCPPRKIFWCRHWNKDLYYTMSLSIHQKQGLLKNWPRVCGRAYRAWGIQRYNEDY